MSNDADAERVAELARGVVADHDPKKVPIPGVSRRLLRRRPVVGALPRRPRRARGVSRSAGRRRPHPAGCGWTGAARAQPDGLRHGRADDPRACAERGREASVAAAPGHHRRPLVSAVFGAGCRVRSGRARHLRGTRRRRVGDQRSEGVDEPRPPGALGAAAGPHQPGRAKAQGVVLLRHRHAWRRAWKHGRCAS